MIEYALLLSIIGIAAVLIMPTIQDKMAAVFSGWGTEVHDNLWIPNPPVP